LWEPVAPSGAQPDVAVVARETIELAFLAAIRHLPPRQRAVLRRYMDAVERADLAAVAALLAEDVRATMPPYPMWLQGRDTVVATLAASWGPRPAGIRGPVPDGPHPGQPLPPTHR
jgi:hypothetical protein